VCYRRRDLRAGAYAFLTAGLVYSGWNLQRNLVEPNTAELAYLTDQIRAAPAASLRELCVVLSPLANLAGYHSDYLDLKAEFGRTTTMLRTDISHLMMAAALNAAVNTLSKCAAVIDMRQFQWKFRSEHNLL
jgi:hypothetical protein